MRSEEKLLPLDLILLTTARALSLREFLELDERGQIRDPRSLSNRPVSDYDLERTFTLFDLMQTARLVMSSSWLQRWPTISRDVIVRSVRGLLTEGRLATFDGQSWDATEHALLKLVHHPVENDEPPVAA